MKLSEEQINKIMQYVWDECTASARNELGFTDVRNALKRFKFKIDDENLESTVSSEEEKYNKLLEEYRKQHNEQFKVGDEVLYVLPVTRQETKKQFEYIIAKAQILELRNGNTAKIKFLEVIREVTGNGIIRYYCENNFPYAASLQFLYLKDDGHLGAKK